MAKPINEEKLAEARTANRQNKAVPFLIRDDGMLYPNVPLVAKNPRYRPYHGDPKANLQQRLAWLSGEQTPKRRQVVMEPEPFNLSKANAQEIVSFALEEFGAALDVETPLDTLRKQCFNLAQTADSVDSTDQPAEQEPAPAPRRGRPPRNAE